jgi:hypothetical protein
MLQTFANGAMEWFVDHDRHVLFGRWSGDFSGEELLTAIPLLWRQHPEVVDYGAIHDLLDFTGIIEHRYSRELMRRTVEAFGRPNPQRRTGVVTSDPMKVFEIKVVKVEAQDRQIRLFGNNATALAWVTADAGGNPSAGGGRSAAALPWWFDRIAAAAEAGVR